MTHSLALGPDGLVGAYPEEFTCGVDSLDRYLREQAGQDVRRRTTACFVAREIATNRIAGFYTLAAAGVLLALTRREPSSCPCRRGREPASGISPHEPALHR